MIVLNLGIVEEYPNISRVVGSCQIRVIFVVLRKAVGQGIQRLVEALTTATLIVCRIID